MDARRNGPGHDIMAQPLAFRPGRKFLLEAEADEAGFGVICVDERARIDGGVPTFRNSRVTHHEEAPVPLFFFISSLVVALNSLKGWLFDEIRVQIEQD